jgi:hypothetical protein
MDELALSTWVHMQWDHTLLWRARLPCKDAADAGVDLVNSSLYVQDVGRFLFTYPISSGDLVWTVGCHGEIHTSILRLGLLSNFRTSYAW